MPNSSKSSWTPSQSQARTQTQRRVIERPPEALADVEQEYLPIKPPGINIPIPLLFGYKYRIQTKFVSSLFLAALCYTYGSLIQNEWFYLLATGFVMVAALSWALPALQILQLHMEVRLPENVQVEDTGLVQLRVFRHGIGKLFSLFLQVRSINVAVDLERRGTRKRPPQKIISPEPYYIDVLEEEVDLDLVTPGLKRGVYILNSVELSSWFPFGFVWWYHKISPRSSTKSGKTYITVFPKVRGISGTFLLRLKAQMSSMGLISSSSIVVPQSSLVRGVREFKYGDSPRHIHWPSSAKAGKLLVREFDSETLPAYDLYLDLRADWKDEAQFELAVLAANSLLHSGHAMGIMPTLIINPAFDSPEVADLMSDLPKLQPGLMLVSEILARVEPVAWQDVSDRSKNALFDHFSESNRSRTVISLVPSNETIMRHTADKGDVVTYPVIISQVEDIVETIDQPEVKAGAKIQFKAARQTGVAADRSGTAMIKTVLSSAISTITSEDDLAAL
jgi:Protein of unknown function DUF58